MTKKKLLWSPTEERIQSSNVSNFIKKVNEKFGLDVKSYDELYYWSISSLELFYSTLWEFTNVKYSKMYDSIIEDINVFPGTKWFPGARLNFAENLLKYNDNKIALIFRGEANAQYVGKKFTYKQLYTEVAKLAKSLINGGIEAGDRVAAYMPNIIETVIAMLSCTSIGAIWASCGSELGSSAVIDRLGQIEPKILFTSDGYLYKGKRIDNINNIRDIRSRIPSLETVIVYPFLSNSPDINEIKNSVLWDDYKSNKENLSINFVQLSFNHPLYIMFSSGTTGKPKSMVQSAGGVLMTHLKELILHTDVKRADVICYVTSPSWMMWNWLVSSLAVGATILLFNGNPSFPDWKSIWKIIEDEKISIFGTSASYINYLMKEKLIPKDEFDLVALREISQTASALSAEGFQFVYNSIKEDIHFNSISGGTDINGCFAAGSPISPVYAGQIQSAALAMKIKAYNEKGEAVTDEQGEMVCELPSPSMPIYFWNDSDFSRYKSSYFDYYKHLGKQIWRHGDYIVIDSHTGGVTFHGRSDAVLKPSGVRIGTSEIYNIIELIPEIEDSVVIGQKWNNDQRIILFVKLVKNQKLTNELKSKIKNNLKEKASPRHIPAIIVETHAIPYTFSNKKVEISISNIAHGRKVTNRESLVNPESLDYFEKYFESLKKANS